MLASSDEAHFVTLCLGAELFAVPVVVAQEMVSDKAAQ